MAADQSPVGCLGRVIVATRGTAGPGEVLIQMNGGTEAFLAWSDEALAVGTEVVVYGTRGGRMVDVTTFHNEAGGGVT